MRAINWVDSYYADESRVVLTHEQMRINGIRVFGKHEVSKAIPGLSQHYHQNAFEITYVTKGNVSFGINQKEYKLSGGDLFISFPDEVHSTGTSPLTINEMYWMQLDVSNRDNFLSLSPQWSNYLIDSLYRIQNRVIKMPNKDIQPILCKFFYLITTQPKEKYYEAVILLVNFLHEMINYDKQTRFSLTPDIANAAEYILENYTETITLEELATISKLSLSRFKENFKNQLGVTPREFINSYRIEQAKDLLLENNSITDVAMKLGFSSSNYFSFVFKRFTTLSPTEYIVEQIKSDFR